MDKGIKHFEMILYGIRNNIGIRKWKKEELLSRILELNKNNLKSFLPVRSLIALT